jgi:Zn-dependent protease
MRFGGTLKIATLFRIPVKIHWTFGLLFLYVLYTSVTQNLGVNGTLFFASFVLCLFVCVVLHEFGHALTARRFGVDTVDIILLPIGGVARLTHLPKLPRHEFLIAIAGPMVNVVIAAVLGVFLFLTRDNPLMIKGSEMDMYEYPSNFLPLLLILNISLIVFNMIPAFPMDGGRVLRALLSLKTGRLKATRIASILGQILAVVFLIYGLMNGHVILGLIGVFIFLSAGNEYRMVKTEMMLTRGKARDLMRTEFTIIPSDSNPSDLLPMLETQGEPYYLVSDTEGTIIGILSAEALQLMHMKPDFAIHQLQEIVSTHYVAIDADTALYDVIRLFKTHHYTLVPVYEKGELAGVIDSRSLS